MTQLQAIAPQQSIGAFPARNPEMDDVLVIPMEVLGNLQGFAGFRPDYRACMGILFPDDRRFTSWLPRGASERDRRSVQLCPFLVVTCGPSRVLVYHSADDDKRKRRASIGTVGHVEYSDRLAAMALSRDFGFGQEVKTDAGLDRLGLELAKHRELQERVPIASPHTVYPLGLLRDESEVVNKTRLGIAYRVDLALPWINHQDTEAGRRFRWQSWDQLAKQGLPWDPWTRILLNHCPAGFGQGEWSPWLTLSTRPSL